MKKRTRHDRDFRKRQFDRFIADHNASASSWGAADNTESESTTSSSSDSGFDADIETPLDNTADPDTTPTQPPPRKRRHLDADDVGRFASMSIERNGRSRDRRGIKPSEVITPASPKLHPIFDTNATSQSMQPDTVTFSNDALELKPSSVEEPLDNDESMRARKGPSTVQLDSDRFFVTSLDDSSSDEEESAEKAEKERVNRIMENVTDTQLRDVLSSTSSAEDGKDDSKYVINGELISRLQALEWQQRMGIEQYKAAQPLFSRPISTPKRRDSSTTPESVVSRSALILWRQPDNLSLNFGKTSMPMSVAQNQSSDSPVVLEDGQFAYVHRPNSTEQPIAINNHAFQSLQAEPAHDMQDDTMDMD
ncbi:hypothetical protein L7F22_068266 [Adiantum nelumboides]|nr:hypothetical protein [Adiantum nelumboides]